MVSLLALEEAMWMLTKELWPMVGVAAVLYVLWWFLRRFGQ